LRLFEFRGITVFLHWTWFIAAIYLIVQSTENYHSGIWKVAEYLALFGIVILHEFGHALACRSVGGRAEKIILWPLGGVAFVAPPPRAGAVLWSIAAGPLVNVLLLPVTVALLHFGRGLNPDLTHFLWRMKWINITLLIFNMLPIYPLDGGQILQSLLWFFLSRGRSLLIAASIGILGAAALGLLALYERSLFAGMIAVFAGVMAWNGIRAAMLLLAQENPRRRTEAACPYCGSHPPIGNHWTCPCGHDFDTFQTGGICLICGNSFNVTQCGDCGKDAPIQQWMPARAGSYAPTRF
jgi:Zn-dependent protease